MALTDKGVARVVEFGIGRCKVTLAAGCNAGDILGVAEDNFDDLRPADCGVDGHQTTGVTYVPRLVAGQDGAANDVITAYAIAVVSGVDAYSGATLGKKLYCGETSTTAGQISETAASTTGDCASIVGMALASDRVLLYPALGSPADTIAA